MAKRQCKTFQVGTSVARTRVICSRRFCVKRIPPQQMTPHVDDACIFSRNRRLCTRITLLDVSRDRELSICPSPLVYRRPLHSISLNNRLQPRKGWNIISDVRYWYRNSVMYHYCRRVCENYTQFTIEHITYNHRHVLRTPMFVAVSSSRKLNYRRDNYREFFSSYSFSVGTSVGMRNMYYQQTRTASVMEIFVITPIIIPVMNHRELPSQYR